MTANVLEAEAVSFAYGTVPVLDAVSMHVAEGEFVALVGPNGSGKSTLLRILLGLLPPMSGRVTVLGKPLRDLRERWRVGYVPQRPTREELVPATVEEVVASGRLAQRGWFRRLRAHDWAEVEHALESVALLDDRRRPIAELSGGQLQRAHIAKALVTGPELLVLDEPVAGVDGASQRRFRDSLVHLVREHRAAVLLVSHELGAVADDLDRVLVLRRGTIVFDGRPGELVERGVSLGVHDDDLPVWLEADR